MALAVGGPRAIAPAVMVWTMTAAGWGPAAAQQDDGEPNAAIDPDFDLVAWIIIANMVLITLAFVITSFTACHYRSVRREAKRNEQRDSVIVFDDAVKSMLRPSTAPSGASTLDRHRTVHSQQSSLYGNSQAIVRSIFVPVGRVRLGESLGEGEFAEVRAGTFVAGGRDGSDLDVAVKAIKGGAIADDHRDTFENEMSLMAQLRHPNVLRMLAVIPDPLMIVMERVSERSVKDYIHDRGYCTAAPVPWPTLLLFVQHTATGLRYLSERGVIHRDLAARNVLLHVESRTNFKCKVADFGLSKVVAQQRFVSGDNQAVPIPLRWTAPEALFFGAWSEKSDVWSWAVMVWELTTHGQFPYTLVDDDVDAIELVQEGLRLHQNPMVPNELYGLLQACWHPEPEFRPRFARVGEIIQGLTARLTNRDGAVVAGDIDDWDAVSFQALDLELVAPEVTPTMMEFQLPECPVYGELEEGTPIDDRFYAISIDENEDSCFIAVKSPYVGDVRVSTKIVKRTTSPARVVHIPIDPDDLLPGSARYVRRTTVLDSDDGAAAADPDSPMCPPRKARRATVIRPVFPKTAAGVSTLSRKAKKKGSSGSILRSPKHGPKKSWADIMAAGPSAARSGKKKRRPSGSTVLFDLPEGVELTAVHGHPPARPPSKSPRKKTGLWKPRKPGAPRPADRSGSDGR
mmetsp:Transcript_34918/g.91400  ORF Transcript_34918/g.91400 Transcript_34918/m.91400 type:complete len:685 (+) Transcript_34918:266-2320(+)